MRLFRLQGTTVQAIPERSYRDKEVDALGEKTLEDLLVRYPEIVPGEEIDPVTVPQLVAIRSQAGVTAGSMDILMTDQHGVPTVVEVKLIDNREIRRSVLAQGLEYLAHLKTEWSAKDMLRHGSEFWNGRQVDFSKLVSEKLNLGMDELEERLTRNLESGRLRLIIAGDELPIELQPVIEFMNEAASFDVLGLEVKMYATGSGDDCRLLAPRVIGATTRAQDRKRQGRTHWTEDAFFDALALSDTAAVAVARRLLSFAVELTGRPVDWGSGTERGSFTARLIVDGRRFSLFSVYTSAELSVNFGWNSALDAQSKLGLMARTNQALGTQFEEREFLRGWPMFPIAALDAERETQLRKLMTTFVAEMAEG